MKRVADVLACVLAGFCVAALTGGVAGAALAVQSWFDDPSARALSTLMLIPAGAVFGALIGGIPGALVVVLSKARYMPWRSIPVLTAGTSIGFLVVLIAGEMINTPALGLGGLIVGAVLGGIVAALLLGRSAPFNQH